MQALMTITGTITTILGGCWVFDLGGSAHVVEQLVKMVIGG